MSLSARLAKLERQAPAPSATPEQIEQLVAELSELEERAKREPWLQEHVDALFAFINSYRIDGRQIAEPSVGVRRTFYPPNYST